MKPPLSAGRWANLLRPRPLPDVVCTESGKVGPEGDGPLHGARGSPLSSSYERYRPLSPCDRIRLFSTSNNMTKATSPAVVE